MNEREAMEYIGWTGSLGIVPGLDNMRELCRRMGDPQKGLTFVHVAGTNGKGSVSTYIASVLKNAGYNIGRYISPVIFDYRERIQVNDRYITKKALCQGIEEIKRICEGMTAEGLPHPTAFEIETALSFWYFREKGCDIVVLETGMGGLLDATNIVENTAVAVLTSISMDHMNFLGKTLEQIALHKSGIIKSGCYVVSACQDPMAMTVIQKRAAELCCPLAVVGLGNINNIRYGLERQYFDYSGYKRLEITLAGKYQIENAALAVDALAALEGKGYAVTEAQLRKGLAEAHWPGRFTITKKHPLFIVDGAHNEDAVKRLAESIEFYFTNRKIIFIIGVLKDKEYDKIIELTYRYAEHIITVTPPENPRALPAYDLAREAARVHPRVTAVDSLEEAVEMSHLLAGKEDVIIAFGSLSYLGRLIETVEKNFGKAVKKKNDR